MAYAHFKLLRDGAWHAEALGLRMALVAVFYHHNSHYQLVFWYVYHLID